MALRRIVVLAVLLALVPAAQAQQGGRTWTVTDFGDATGDSRDPGPPGSLRYVLTRQARPGDTIVFSRPALVQLTRPLTVSVDRVRILGAVGEGRAGLNDRSAVAHWRSGTSGAFALFVQADDAVVQGLTFSNVPLVVHGTPANAPARARILDNLFVARHGIVGVVEAVGTVVQGNEFAGSQDTAVGSSLTRRTTIRGNVFGVAGKVGIDDAFSRELVVAGNRFRGSRVTLGSRSGRVADNVWEGVRGIALHIAPEADQSGPLVVEGNRVAGGSLLAGPRGGLVRLAGNTLQGRGSGTVHVGTCFEGARGSLVVERNTVERGALAVNCRWDVPVTLDRNTVTGAAGPGIRVDHGKRVRLEGNRLERNGGGGIWAFKGTRVTVTGGTVAGNRGPGVAIFPGSETSVRGVRMGGNGGPGIELAPNGVSPNAPPGAPALKYDKPKGKLRGSACAGCLVEVFESEDGAKQGNAEHGEGTRLLGAVRASGSGAVVFPPKGTLDCPRTGKVTATTTRKDGRQTSEFARDVECSCVIGSEFRVEGAPSTGFANYGITVVFPAGAKVGEVTLTDPATEKAPGARDLGPLLQWELTQNPPSVEGGEHDFFVTVTYRDRTGPLAAPVSKVWHLGVVYDPPKGRRSCDARLAGIWRPVR